jgi:hypothetical protein
MKTAMQDLKEDLQETIKTRGECLNDINDVWLRNIIKDYFEATINNVIKRIDEELLEKEKEQIMEAYRKGYTQAFLETTEPEYYYNETYLE